MTPTPGRLATRDGWKDPPISTRSERMPSRSNGDGGAARGCGDREQRVPGWPIEVGGGESLWAG